MFRTTFGGTALELAQGDITRSETVAIANAANAMLMGGGGVDGAIHRAAGPELMEALRAIKRDLPGGVLETGKAVVTPGFGLRASWIIHCVGPIYQREGAAAPALLGSCYREAMLICRERRIASVSFPSISTGVYGYPLDEAAPIALAAVRDAAHLSGAPSLVRFALFDAPTLQVYVRAAQALGG
jgi:O-acetyl-ADP-ribose deacetylase (regulator of RNase III)